MNCTQCGAPGAKPLTLVEPGFTQISGGQTALCERCIEQCEVMEFHDALMQLSVEKLGPYGAVLPNPKTVESFVTAMASQLGRIIGMVHADSPEIASDMLGSGPINLERTVIHSPF